MSKVGGDKSGVDVGGGSDEGGILPWTTIVDIGIPTEQEEGIEVPVSKKSNNNKKPTHRCQKLLCELLHEFANNTGLHGPRYTTLQGLSLVEKIFWITAFVLSLILCIILILQVWGKWTKSTPVATFTEHHMHISKVPFPAVTICPKAKIDQNAYNYTDNAALYSDFDIAELLFQLSRNLETQSLGGMFLMCRYQFYILFLMDVNEYDSFRHACHLWSDQMAPDDLGLVWFQPVTRATNLSNNLSHVINHKLTASSLEGYRKFRKLQLMCDNFAENKRRNKYSMYYNKVKEVIAEAAPKINQIFLNGSWQGKELNITQGDVTEVLMEEGLCFTFNSLSAAEILNNETIQKDSPYLNNLNESKLSKGWGLETGYLDDTNDGYPRRSRVRTNNEPELKLYLQQNFTSDKLCNGDDRGFKVYLHHPGDLPQSSMFYYTVLPGFDNSISIIPNVLQPSINMESKCPLSVRKCYFVGEMKLKYFKLYSQNNCQLECLNNYTTKLCDCIWFYMPGQQQQSEQLMYSLCSHLNEDCIKRAAASAVSEESTNGNMGSCQCLPLCNSVQYRAEIYKTNEPSNNGTTIIKMKFRDNPFISRTRDCSGMFELMDFLAYCGGLLGLFLGFSFLSLVEIFYFCTLRMFCMFRKDNQAKKKKDKRTKQKRSKKF